MKAACVVLPAWSLHKPTKLLDSLCPVICSALLHIFVQIFFWSMKQQSMVWDDCALLTRQGTRSIVSKITLSLYLRAASTMLANPLHHHTFVFFVTFSQRHQRSHCDTSNDGRPSNFSKRRCFFVYSLQYRRLPPTDFSLSFASHRIVFPTCWYLKCF